MQQKEQDTDSLVVLFGRLCLVNVRQTPRRSRVLIEAWSSSKAELLLWIEEYLKDYPPNAYDTVCANLHEADGDFRVKLERLASCE